MRALDDCPLADANGDGVLTIEELVRSVAAAVLGCPVPPATRTSATTPSVSATVSTTPNESGTPTPTRTTGGSPSVSPSSSVTGTSTATPTPTISSTATITPTGTQAPGATETVSPTIAPSATSTPTATPSPSPTPTRTPTSIPAPSATFTPTPTSTPSPQPFVRRFSLDAASSEIRIYVFGGDGPATPGFQGYLDLSMGDPDAKTGLAPLQLLHSSEFLYLPLGDGRNFCIRPSAQVNIGVIACDGGFDLGVKTTQDHHLGQVGVGDFTEGDCNLAGGVVEGPGDPHPNVCNGPVVVASSGEADSGAGAMLIAPDQDFQTNGIPAQLSVEPGPCEQHVAPEQTTLGFTSALYRVEIADPDNAQGQQFVHEERGQNFSCPSFTQENGPGRLVLSIGTLHGAAGLDVVTVLDLDD
jgi:hypothetical protein